MAPAFRQGQVPVPDLEHVGIVVAPETHAVEQERVLVEDLGDARPPGCDVAGDTPGVAGGIAPDFDVGLAPFAETVEDGTILC